MDRDFPPLHYIRKEKGFWVINPAIPRCIEVNDVGYFMLTLMEKGLSLEKVAKRVSSEYDVEYQEALKDVSLFYKGIVKSGILNKKGKWQLKKVDIGVYFEITHRCNLECIYCYATPVHSKGEFLNTQEVKKILKNLKNGEVSFVILSGGEPLIREDIFPILRYSASLFPTILLTNATLITKDVARKISYISNLSIRVSIDGATKEKNDPLRGEGSFEKTLKGIENLISCGLGEKISLASTITSINEDVDDLVEFALDKGISSLVITPLVPSGKGGKVWNRYALKGEALLNFYRKLYYLQKDYKGKIKIYGSLVSALEESLKNVGLVNCPVGYRSAVDWQGNLYPCSLMMFPKFKVANLKETSFKKALEDMKKYQEIAILRKDKISQCRLCPWRGYCTSGCMARAYLTKGTLWAEDPDCDVIQETLNWIMNGKHPSMP